MKDGKGEKKCRKGDRSSSVLDSGQKILFHGGVEVRSKKTFYRLPHLTR